MCPDKKLKWFEEHGWEPEAIEEVRQLVIQRWTESYKPVPIPATAVAPIAPALLAEVYLRKSCRLKLR
jgi:hypothetical protein